uniref:Uncharacterized protein n=1 Tax=Caenorhabditis japonica TaxID=281687 RepID=A0A8R1E0E9_CAEJA
MCVTLFPNLPGSTFVVRGCLESVLRHAYREDTQLHSDGCYLLRSLPMFPNTVPMDYVVCTCHGDYCNNIDMPNVVEKPYSFAGSGILKLAYSDDERSLQIATSVCSREALWATSLIISIYSVCFLGL